ncbi:MAG: TatD family hydrolase [Candidatus Berkelbacteria bacterium]|nr:TatD family hydrolase [Candidatus Berkelbacteria bacterium]
MIDTHAHLNFEKFKDDVGAVLGRAIDKGIKKFIVPSSNLENSKRAVDLARKYPEVYAAIGLHPIHAKEMSINVLQHFYTLLSAPKIVAVGEIGLDYFYLGKSSKYAEYPSKEEQKVVLIEMLKMAQDTRLPLILHCREAYSDLFNIIQNEGIIGPGVIHCFMGDKDIAKKFLDLGFFISFTGNITFGQSLNSIVKYVPTDKILIETDAPYLTPEVYRGKRNEPAYLIEVARKIAEVKKIPLVEVESATDKNAQKLFKI